MKFSEQNGTVIKFSYCQWKYLSKHLNVRAQSVSVLIVSK